MQLIFYLLICFPILVYFLFTAYWHLFFTFSKLYFKLIYSILLNSSGSSFRYWVTFGELKRVAFWQKTSLVWRNLTLAINFLFYFYIKCTRVINSPSRFTLDPYTKLCKLKDPLKIPGIFKVPFMISFQHFFFLSLSMCIWFFG